MGDFTAHNSRWRLALMFVGCIAFVAAGLWMGGALGDAPSSRRYGGGVIFGVGWFSVLFFGLCAVAVAKRYFDRRSQLKIGPCGVFWRPWSDCTIPWSEIADVTVWKHQRQKAIVLHLTDPVRFPARGLTRKFGGANRYLTGGDISISLTGTDRSFEEAMWAIEQFRSAAPHSRH